MAEKGFTREEYDRICAKAKKLGITIVTKYRKGMKTIRCGDIILSEKED